MSKPKDNDWRTFGSIPAKEKADVLFLYLCKDFSSMEDVIRQYYHTYDTNYTQRVSVITRCYGFEGRNAGRFRKLGANPDDVYAFVKAFPNGAEYDGEGKTMYNYLVNRIKSRINVNKSQVEKMTVKDKNEINENWFDFTSSAVDLAKNYSQNTQSYDLERKDRIESIGGLIILISIILTFLLLKLVFGLGWIVSILCALVGGLIIGKLVVRPIMNKFLL